MDEWRPTETRPGRSPVQTRQRDDLFGAKEDSPKMASERDELLLTHAGKLQQLQETIETAEQFSDIHAKEAEQLEQLDELRKQLNKLREKRDSLKQQLTIQRDKQVSDVIVNEKKSRQQSDSERTISGSQIQKKIWDDKKKRRIDDLQVTHRLTGRTIFRLPQGLYGIRFDTYFENEFCDSFYAVLAQGTTDSSKLCVYKHTIPYFVPLKRIETRFLGRSIKLFSDCVHEYLRAYTARRSMIARLKEIDPEITGLVTSDACDYVIFHKQYRGHAFEIRLIYETPRDTLPLRCAVLLNNGANKKRMEKAEKFFYIHPVHIAHKLTFKLQSDASQ